jgi:hypothetical protein
MCKIHCTELLFDAVFKCMQVVGVNSVDKKLSSSSPEELVGEREFSFGSDNCDHVPSLG